jgi:hypothetical protein
VIASRIESRQKLVVSLLERLQATLYSATRPVEDGKQVQEARFRRNVGDIRRPHGSDERCLDRVGDRGRSSDGLDVGGSGMACERWPSGSCGASGPAPRRRSVSIDSRPSSEPLRADGIAGQQSGSGLCRSSACTQHARLGECPFYKPIIQASRRSSPETS